MITLQFQIIGGGLNKRGGPTDNLNMNKRVAGGFEKCSRSKVATRYQ